MLIAMAVYDTKSNKRTWMTERTLRSLMETVRWDRHRLIISDNGSCDDTRWVYEIFEGLMPFEVIYNERNLGTAAAINLAWRKRNPGEHCVKMDNDVVIHQADWADWMEDVFERRGDIGICGLKRKDLAESPFAEGDMQSEVYMLPHLPGQRWLVVEEVKHVIGTCQAYSSRLLEHIGYLYQPGLYGFDDGLAAVRAKVAGFKSVFLHGFDIDHIDPGGDKFCAWKRGAAARWFPEYNSLVVQYEAGIKPVYYDGGFNV